ncbi:MAG: Rrf2 family transcriptional regulator [Candidatus Omnitrophica bacterium]|nr:Rrf2 family transcriptional regulator [Candidatus Omnitrophota bacterium]MDD5653303.1 Rrf2 family transcriptional regulator [Candidatus Omnitrophota bacterium]
MKLITRDTDYAMRALIFLAQQKNRVISVSELVRELKTPRPFSRKILQQLNKAKILRSFKGNHGGFILAKKPKEIFLVDLIRVFQGPLELNECIFKKKICPNRNCCVLRNRISRIENKVLAELGAITVGSLLKE